MRLVQLASRCPVQVEPSRGLFHRFQILSRIGMKAERNAQGFLVHVLQLGVKLLVDANGKRLVFPEHCKLF